MTTRLAVRDGNVVYDTKSGLGLAILRPDKQSWDIVARTGSINTWYDMAGITLSELEDFCRRELGLYPHGPATAALDADYYAAITGA